MRYTTADRRMEVEFEGADGKESSLGADEMARKVSAFRKGLDVGKARSRPSLPSICAASKPFR